MNTPKTNFSFLEFSQKFVEKMNSESNGNVKIFFYITQIAYFPRPFEKNTVTHMEKGLVEFLIKFLEPEGNFFKL